MFKYEVFHYKVVYFSVYVCVCVHLLPTCPIPLVFIPMASAVLRLATLTHILTYKPNRGRVPIQRG